MSIRGTHRPLAVCSSLFTCTGLTSDVHFPSPFSTSEKRVAFERCNFGLGDIFVLLLHEAMRCLHDVEQTNQPMAVKRLFHHVRRAAHELFEKDADTKKQPQVWPQR